MLKVRDWVNIKNQPKAQFKVTERVTEKILEVVRLRDNDFFFMGCTVIYFFPNGIMHPITFELFKFNENNIHVELRGNNEIILCEINSISKI